MNVFSLLARHIYALEPRILFFGMSLHNSTLDTEHFRSRKNTWISKDAIVSRSSSQVSASVILYDTFKIPRQAVSTKHCGYARLIHF